MRDSNHKGRRLLSVSASLFLDACATRARADIAGQQWLSRTLYLESVMCHADLFGANP